MNARSERRALSVAVSIVIGALLALGLSEVAVRVAGLAPELRTIDVTHDDTVYRRSTNPILAFELKPDWRDSRADLMRSYPFTNSHGQRDVERTRKKPAGRERVLLLGASVVEGVGIRDLDDTISRQMERFLGNGTEVLNFGVSAYCTRAKVELLRVKGLAFDPDVAVLFVSANDFNNFNTEAFQLAAPRARPPAADWVYAHSHVFRAIAVRADWLGYRAQNDPVAWSREAIGDNNVVEGMKEFARLAAEHGFDPVVAIWPRFTDTAVEDTDPVPGRPDVLLLEAIAWMDGLPTFRFSTFFRADLARSGEANPRGRYTIGDRLHPNQFGARLAAAALTSALPSLRGRFRPETAIDDVAVVEAARERGERRPSEARRLVNVGNALLGEGRVEEAIASYRDAIEESPDLAEAHYNLGVALLRSASPADAVRALEQALALQPDFEAAERELATARAAVR